MEKFGIFELLDALSQITAVENQPAQPQSPETNDAAFTPPSYGSETKAEPTEAAQSSAPQQKASDPARALEEFLSRHNRISEQADKNKR
ncbi:MAG: hypothetical protein K2L87_00300 [Clostridiales bacterium]|nr:hypothetical protein [Clostridiales bacterium]